MHTSEEAHGGNVVNMLRYNPDAHGTQLARPVVEPYCPVLQGKQAKAPVVGEYVPAAQVMHVDDAYAPAVVEYLPGGHEAQFGIPVADWNWPPPQGVHPPAESAEYAPAAHGVQLVAYDPSGEKKPAAQL